MIILGGSASTYIGISRVLFQTFGWVAWVVRMQVVIREAHVDLLVKLISLSEFDPTKMRNPIEIVLGTHNPVTNVHL